MIGDGPQYKDALKKAGLNVSVLGYQPDNILLKHMQEAKAFIFMAEEDFGIGSPMGSLQAPASCSITSRRCVARNS